jgi:hypothetical protein
MIIEVYVKQELDLVLDMLADRFSQVILEKLDEVAPILGLLLLIPQRLDDIIFCYGYLYHGIPPSPQRPTPPGNMVCSPVWAGLKDRSGERYNLVKVQIRSGRTGIVRCTVSASPYTSPLSRTPVYPA